MMKKNFKIITLILSCLLLIGAVVGISVSAADEPTVAIAKKSISYEGAIRIAYAIDAQNIADDQEVKLLFSYDEISTPTGKLDETKYEYVKGAEGTKTIDGVTYPLVFSNGFAPVEMTKPVYALPVIIDADGNIITSGTSHKLSIFEYCTTRFSGSFTEDQLELYKALLHYGASVQEALVGSEVYPQSELDKYGWADAFYVTTVTTKVDGVVDSTETVCYRAPDVTLEAPKTYNGKMFAGFTDAEGNALAMYGIDKTAATWNYYNATLPIGETAFTYNYAGGSVQTWDDITTPGASGYIYNQGSAQLDSLNEAKTSAYTENGALSLYNNGWALVNIDNKNSKTGEVGKTYVFETDIMLEKPTSYSGDSTMGVFYLANNYEDAYNKHFTYFPINYTDKSTGGNRYSIRLADNTATNGNWTDLAYLQFDEWYNVRIEYTVKVLGTTGNDIGSIRVYVDGEKVADYASSSGINTGKSNSTFGGVGWEAKGTGKYTFHFDNTYIATE